ncbi:ABC transporter substrate-binding protein [Acetobacterium woodii]|uniref:Nitrate/sulfonate/bicarbonate ABC transport system substrate binding protein SsuA3 n=1 Tax=Acetobacterium woodii (strain ATCC 29683 / DSM 1030 / JCM 2381 / KCTC 1655 / WB1) TaxID=931626 RepID=H6LEV8_ACEWD|nr:ABC transporter substrate-binding protein [Acetobacterium woodii]AFA49401.1 nitrate/sulfonate/bicarbonate ABC transport system substrate binding protein SsuA3 [Acetobacterium woodii DSM 1030]
MKKITIASLIILLITLGSSGCHNQKDNTASIHAKVGTWKTAQTIQPFFYQNYLAANDQIEVVPFTNPGDMKSALLVGSLDLCGTTMVTAITAASKGEPVVVVSGLSNKCSALVVGKDSDIFNEADLRGKKIAYVPGTMHHLLLLEVLKRNGLDPEKDVKLMRIDFFDMGQALAQGTVDAFYSGEPYPSIAVAEGYGRILSYPSDDETFAIINSAMMTTKEKIASDRDLIQRLVTAHVEATDDLEADKNIWLSKAAEFGTDPQVLAIASDNIDLFWDIDADYINRVKNLAQRMKDQGLITDIPDIEAMFDLSFIEQVKVELKK